MTTPPLNRQVELRSPRLILRPCTHADAVCLCNLICNDHALRAAAHMSPNARPTPNAYLRDTERWAQAHASITLAMVDAASNEAIGLISLSHIDPSARTGRIGYWLASARWGQRLTTEAFGLMLSLARQLGLTAVHANIEQANTASWRIWTRHGATLTPQPENRYRCSIQLEANHENGPAPCHRPGLPHDPLP